jgi:acetoacetyl-CoA synthetase
MGTNLKSWLTLKTQTFDDLYAYSCDKRAQFYGQLFDYLNVIHTGSYSIVVDESAPIDSVPRWFDGVRCNWAENLLYSRGRADPPDHHGTFGKEDGKVAVTEVREGNSSVRSFTWADLRREAGRLASAMKARGVKKGDRIVLVGANSFETLLIFLATTWLGGLFSSSSTDMGASGILQRTVQINPKVSWHAVTLRPSLQSKVTTRG